jgi:uncharacterized protein
VGLSVEDVRRQRLPLPQRDMLPRSIEEQLVCYADKFFSKNGLHPSREKKVERIFEQLAHYGPDKVLRFRQWVEVFE